MSVRNVDGARSSEETLWAAYVASKVRARAATVLSPTWCSSCQRRMTTMLRVKMRPLLRPRDHMRAACR